MPDHHPLLRKLAALSPLSVEERHVLARVVAHPVAIPARTDLVRDGDQPRGAFIVVEGIACRYKILLDGARQVLAFLVPGDFVGLDADVVDTMDHAVGTLTPCCVVDIPPLTMRNLLDNHPGIARALRIAALAEAATARQWLVNLGRRPCEQRLAHVLCEMLVRLRSVGLASAAEYRFPLTQIDLADATGMTSVHVNRSLQALRARGLIEGQGRSIVIRDVAALEAVADFDPGYLRQAARLQPESLARRPGLPAGGAFRETGLPAAT
ncbi:Crp/Fnr family transcriptional regulator [Methylobacterium sp. yr596]|uniref:Crp/Fnr family transcriptional regulator n=1 Tax=Methylobacterium sp. yr596 TaxID=1761800 RepID=UPI0008E68FBA|nr:Crp/Fnr family transcriptional regulator [Methylobacterium sp. yr596]SFE91729.1 cAMP-binding domain of CRP or a regulatory subunit of cAMP-dependent protein kinases [Methylobacterium sp. yr596]